MFWGDLEGATSRSPALLGLMNFIKSILNAHLKAFPAKNFKFSSVNPRPQDALNFILSVVATYKKIVFDEKHGYFCNKYKDMFYLNTIDF